MLVFFILVLLCTRGYTQNNGDLRLKQKNITNSAFTAGRLEIYLNREWGTVCEDHFSAVDANVACRQLGYSGSIDSPTPGFHTPHGMGEENQPIWLDDVGCADPSGVHILSCPNAGVGVQNCDHFSDIALSCSPVPISSPVRLNGQTYQSQGSLEVNCEGEWIPACVQNIDTDKADVICKELGYTEVKSFERIPNLNFSSIQLDNLFNCFARNCSCSDHNQCGEEVFIECSHSIPFGAIRFVNNSTEILEIFINGVWSGICGDSFTELDGNAVCSKLGYLRVESFSTVLQDNYSIWNKKSDCDLNSDQSFSCLASPSLIPCSQNSLVTLKCSDNSLPTKKPTPSGDIEGLVLSLENLIAICLGSFSLLCFYCLFMIVCCTHLFCGYYVESKRDRPLLDTRTFTFMDSKLGNESTLKPYTATATPIRLQYSTTHVPTPTEHRLTTNSPYPFPQDIERIKLRCSQESLLKKTIPSLSPHTLTKGYSELEQLAHQLEPPEELVRRESLNLEPISEEEVSLQMSSEEQTISVEFDNA